MFMQLAIKNNQKGIFFIESAKKAYEFYSKYKEYCLFNCSKSNKDYYKFVDEIKINQMLKDEKFNELILITTTCLDAGVNINDKELKHIVCDVKDIGTIIQCAGRKRINKDDNELYLYVKSITNQQLGGTKTQIKKRIEMAKYLKDHSPEEYVNKYKRELDYSHIVYDDLNDDNTITKKINLMMYFKSLVDMVEIDKMITYGKFGFCKMLARKLGFYNEEEGYVYNVMEETMENNNLTTYLESLIGKKLLKDEQKELINKISLKDSRGRLQKGINILNGYLKDNKFNYMIISKRTSEREGDKVKTIRYWEILNDIEN
jgi:hypothetical protein